MKENFKTQELFCVIACLRFGIVFNHKVEKNIVVSYFKNNKSFNK